MSDIKKLAEDVLREYVVIHPGGPLGRLLGAIEGAEDCGAGGTSRSKTGHWVFFPDPVPTLLEAAEKAAEHLITAGYKAKGCELGKSLKAAVERERGK